MRSSRLQTGARSAAFTLVVSVGGCQALLDLPDRDAAGQAGSSDGSSQADATLTDGSAADVVAMDGIALADGGPPEAADSADDRAPPSTTFKTIYVRTPEPRSFFNSIDAGDALCGLSRPSGVTSAKALIVGSTRRACTTPDCMTGGSGEHIDWPLLPNTEYRREDGMVVGVTDANGLITTPLTNPIATDAGLVWTGLYEVSAGNATDWTSSDMICADWTDTISQGLTGYAGSANALTGAAFASQNDTCGMRLPIYCVQVAP